MLGLFWHYVGYPLALRWCYAGHLRWTKVGPTVKMKLCQRRMSTLCQRSCMRWANVVVLSGVCRLLTSDDRPPSRTLTESSSGVLGERLTCQKLSVTLCILRRPPTTTNDLQRSSGTPPLTSNVLQRSSAFCPLFMNVRRTLSRKF